MKTIQRAAVREPGGLLRLHVLLGDALVMLAALILLVMPWSEHYCTFDGFLRGRPDFELSLLCVIVMLCLVLLLAALARRSVCLLLLLRSWFCRLLEQAYRGSSRASRERGNEAEICSGPRPAFLLPLRI